MHVTLANCGTVSESKKNIMELFCTQTSTILCLILAEISRYTYGVMVDEKSLAQRPPVGFAKLLEKFSHLKDKGACWIFS